MAASSTQNEDSKSVNQREMPSQFKTCSHFEGKPYLQHLENLEDAYPALSPFLNKLAHEYEPSRMAVSSYFQRHYQRVPGRCYCLEFNDTSVTIVGDGAFENPATLRTYLEENPATTSREKKRRRLFILEDMEPDYVDALGHHLGVDPLVFSEQMNTWNFTDSWNVPHRALPSMSVPEQSFTLRYYELRTLLDPESLGYLQTSFAVNRRRYERWRDIDVPSFGKSDRRHAFVRRCASFWTSQDTFLYDRMDDLGWDAVIMVDPAFGTTCHAPTTKSADDLPMGGETTSKTAKMNGIILDPSAVKNLDVGLILQAPNSFASRSSLWGSQAVPLRETVHKSWPYHNGLSTITSLTMGAKEVNVQIYQKGRRTNSVMDEMVFCWTKLATPELIHQTNEKASNAAYYLLKHVAQHWVSQLEMINTSVTLAELFYEQYQSRIDGHLSRHKWNIDLQMIKEIAKDISSMRRQLSHFGGAMFLNLERLGVQLSSQHIDKYASVAVMGAQMDFITIQARLLPLRDRAEALRSVTTDFANLRAAFKGVSNSERLFASVVFPLVLLTGIFSMEGDYLPGKPQFWRLWAIGLPICLIVAIILVYEGRPWVMFQDLAELARLYLASKEYTDAQDRNYNGMGAPNTEELLLMEENVLKRGTSRRNCDEEHGVDERAKSGNIGGAAITSPAEAVHRPGTIIPSSPLQAASSSTFAK